MIIKNAHTEPFWRFHRFHEEFDRNIKVTFGALHLFSQSTFVEVGKASDLAILPTGDEPWGEHTKWKDPKRVSGHAATFLSQMGLVRVMSAFEDFLVSVRAEHDRYLSLIGATTKQSPKTREEGDDDGGSLGQLFTQLGWSIDPIEFLVPLFDYLSLARNCIVHRSGRASEAFVKHAESPGLATCLSEWPSARGKKLPLLPTVERDQEIPFLPRHSVLATDVCHRAAHHLNAKLASFLGKPGIVYMAAYHTLLADERIPTKAKNSAESLVNYALVGRYRIEDLNSTETVPILKKLNRWSQCLRRFEELYPRAAHPKRRS